jgi:voltage-gated potassium channel Kch
MPSNAPKDRPSWRFAYLLGSLFLLILLHPLLAGYRWGPVLLDLFLSLVVVASAYAVSRTAATRMIFSLLMVPVLTTRWLLYLIPTDTIFLFGLAISSAFIGLVAVRILLYVMKQQTVTTETILAALCVYLLFGVAWGLVYCMVEQLTPGAFRIPETVPARAALQQLLYFSLVTLTTVGYGDISPQSPFSQALANIEAVLGQIYLAVLVARLVGIQVAQRMSSAHMVGSDRQERCSDKPGSGP